MRNALLIYCGGAAALGAVFGLLMVEKEAIVSQNDEAVWESFTSSNDKASISESINRLVESGLIYKSKSIDKQEEDPVPQANLRPDFPSIRSFSIIDNIPQIHLITEDSIGLTAKAGDTLESGWLIKRLDTQSVTVVYGDEEQTISITNHSVLDTENKSEKKDDEL